MITVACGSEMREQIIFYVYVYSKITTKGTIQTIFFLFVTDKEVISPS